MRVLLKNVPYYSQWESPELISRIVSGEVSIKEDPKWKSSGASNLNEYELWSRNACGMACLKMILAHKLGKVLPIVNLCKKCMSYGGYIKGGKSIDGLLYKPFINFIHKEFGLKGRIPSSLSIQDIINELKKGNYVIASVSREIRNPYSKPVKQGGHLVLVLGFDSNKETLSLHNPSGNKISTQDYAVISYKNFRKFFSRRGLIIEG